MTLPSYLASPALINCGYGTLDNCGRAYLNPPPMDPYKRCIAQHGMHHPKCQEIKRNAPQHVRDRVAAQYDGLALENLPSAAKIKHVLKKKHHELKRALQAKQAHRIAKLRAEIKGLKHQLAMGRKHKRGKDGGKMARAATNPRDPVPHLKAIIQRKRHELQYAVQDNQTSRMKALQHQIIMLSKQLEAAMAISLRYYQSTGTEFGGPVRSTALKALHLRLSNLKGRRKKAKTKARKKLIDVQIKAAKRKIARLEKRQKNKPVASAFNRLIGKKTPSAKVRKKGKLKATQAKTKGLTARHRALSRTFLSCAAKSGENSSKCKRYQKEAAKVAAQLKKLGVAVKAPVYSRYTSGSIASSASPEFTVAAMSAAGGVVADMADYSSQEYPGDESYTVPASNSAYDASAYDTSSWSSSGGGGGSYAVDSYSPASAADVEDVYEGEEEEDSNTLTYALIGAATLALGGGAYWYVRKRRGKAPKMGAA